LYPHRLISVQPLAALPTAIGCAGRQAAATVRAWGFAELSESAYRLAAELVANYVVDIPTTYIDVQLARLTFLIVHWHDNAIYIEVTFGGPADTVTWRQIAIDDYRY